MKWSWKSHKLKTAAKITAAIAFIALILVIGFISPLAKYLIEKYDEKYLGRKIETSWVYLNPFTGFVYIRDLKIYGYKSDSIMLSANVLYADYNVLKSFNKTYEIASITLVEPVGWIIQNRKELNFDDLIRLFKPKKSNEPAKKPVHLNVLNIEIRNGEFHYIEQSIPVNYFIKNVNINSTGKRWVVDSINIQYTFKAGPSAGEVAGKCSINFKDFNYRLSVAIEEYDLKFLEQYLLDLANYGSIKANLDAKVTTIGNFKDKLALRADGYLAINDFHFGKDSTRDFAACEKVMLQARLASPIDSVYLIDSVMLNHPVFKYERYDYLDNLQRMFGEKAERVKAAKSDSSQFNLLIEIGDFVSALAKNFVRSYFKVDKVAVYNGDLAFYDYALREKFSVHANPLFLRADSIDRSRTSFKAPLHSELKPYGRISAQLDFNPQDYENFRLTYKLEKLPITLANPYLVSYTSFPLDRGTLDLKGYMNVVEGTIESENHLIIIDPRVGKRVRKKDTRWIPVPFLMSLVRERGDVIDYNIPIEGSLKDPKFKLGDAILDVMRNIFVKPPSTPYIIQVKKLEKEVEKSLNLKWDMRQSKLRKEQERFIEQIAEFLVKDTIASIVIHPIQYAEKEKEHILLFEAKKKFALD